LQPGGTRNEFLEVPVRECNVEKPIITYPCSWSYRVIGTDKELMLKKIPEKLGTIKHTVSAGNQSAKGKYTSLNIDAVVHDEKERLSVLSLLQSIETVKMVI
jgi:putative lipoic acid-binding regulatory protein